MKNLIKVVAASFLALASLTAVAKTRYVTHPPVAVALVPADASGYWVSYQTDIQVILASGKYFAPSYGPGQPPSTCGKVLKATVAIPRTYPAEGLQSATGSFYDSNNVGVAYGETLNLLTSGNELAGTFKVVSYNYNTANLTIELTTPPGGPSGTFVLTREPLTPFIALIVPNCP